MCGCTFTNERLPTKGRDSRLQGSGVNELNGLAEIIYRSNLSRIREKAGEEPGNEASVVRNNVDL